MKFGIALLPDKKTINLIRDLQKDLHQKFDVRQSRQYPHVTIKSPFESGDVEVFDHYIRLLSIQHSKLKLSVEGCSCFENNVVYILVKGDYILASLHKRILSDFSTLYNISPGLFEGENIIFHISIAVVKDKRQAEDVLQYINDQLELHSIIADAFALFVFNEERSLWEVYNQYPLSSIH